MKHKSKNQELIHSKSKEFEDMRNTITLFLLFFSPLFIKGEKQLIFRFQSFQASEGLANNTVTTICQDNKGNIWIGTRNGVSRFDGYRFKNYHHTSEEENSLPHDAINSIFKDQQGIVWIHTERGVAQYNDINDSFTNYHLWNGNILHTDNMICETAKRELLVSSGENIHLYNKEKREFTPLLSENLAKQFVNNQIKGITEDTDEHLWIVADSGFYQLNRNEQSLININKAEPYQEILKNKRARCIFTDKYNRVFLGTINGGIYIIDEADSSIFQINSDDGLLSDNIIGITKDYGNNYWISTDKGINIINQHFEVAHSITAENTGKKGLLSNIVLDIFEDKEQNIWLGSYNGGLNMLPDKDDNIELFAPTNRKYPIKGRIIRDIFQDGQSLWVASEDKGLSKIDFLTGEVSNFMDLPLNELNYHNIQSILVDDEKVWVGTFSRGTLLYNKKTKLIKRYNIEDNTISSNISYCFLKDSKGRFWAGTSQGLNLYNESTNRFIIVEDSTLNSSSISDLYEDSNQNIWIGTRKDGLFKLNHNTSIISNIIPASSPYYSISSIFEDDQQQLWIGSNNNGIIILDSKGATLKEMNKENGFLSNGIKSILSDNQKALWIGSDDGLIYLSRNGEMKLFTENEGLPINQFNYSAALKAENGELYFGTINGMIRINKDKLLNQKPEFKVTPTSISFNGQTAKSMKKALQGKTIENVDIITLSHDQAKHIELSFTGMNFLYRTKTYYAAKLEGKDSTWKIMEQTPTLFLKDLDPDTYILKVKASADGVNWDEKGMKSITINIHPPFWQSFWFIFNAFIILGILILITRGLRERIKLLMQLQREEHKSQNLTELNNQKQRFFAFISHDLKTPLTLMIVPLQQILSEGNLSEDTRKKLKSILSNAQRMHLLVDELMTYSKIDMKHAKIKVQKGPIMLLIQELAEVFEIATREKEINLVIDINSDNLEQEGWFAPNCIEGIIYNLISNAIKYTAPGGVIKVSADIISIQTTDMLQLKIADTGRGISKEKLEKIFEIYYQTEEKDYEVGSGIGLALTKLLANNHKGDIEVESIVGEGTTFTVTIPISENAFDVDERIYDHNNLGSKVSVSKNIRDMFSSKTIHKVEGDNVIHERKKILIIEDNKELNNYLGQIFANNYDVFNVFDGKSGLEKALIENPDLVICDVMMPFMNGIEFTEHLKRNFSTSHIPVILLTAKADESDYTEGYKAGADAYITKPFNISNLKLLVNNLLTTKQKDIKAFLAESNNETENLDLSPKDQKFMDDLIKLIEKNMRNDAFGVDDVTHALGVSRSLLHVKLRRIADTSITSLIRSIKMKKAQQMLIDGSNVSETSFAIGISDPNYFTKCFKKEFGVTPTTFVQVNNGKRKIEK